MEKTKLITLKKAIKDAFKNLFENAPLGYTFKSYLTVTLIMGAFMLVVGLPLYIFTMSRMAKLMPGDKYVSDSMPSRSLGAPESVANMESPVPMELPEGDYSPETMELMREMQRQARQSQQAQEMPASSSNAMPEAYYDTPAKAFGPVAIIISIVVSVLGLGWIFFMATFMTLLPIKIHSQNLVPIKELIGEAFKKLFKFALLTIISAFIIGIGYILLIVPGVIFTLWFLFAPYILLTEDVGVFEALKKSKQMTKGFRGNLFGKGLGYTVLMMLAMIPLLFVMYATQGLLTPIISVFTPLALLKVFEDLKAKQATPMESPAAPSGSEDSENDSGAESGMTSEGNSEAEESPETE
ncbi:hypothetical protein GF360_01820 [candidate division WWE3 bacterium]|nr:hypothetical protein [candidate division WWE3 bacterium]